MNKQDQEEHRLAAKAANYDYREIVSDSIGGVAAYVMCYGVLKQWFPLASKEDGFGLMVAAGISVDSHIDGYAVFSSWREGVEDINVQPEYADPEHYMQAIFNCAVEIGRSMEASNEQSAD